MPCSACLLVVVAQERKDGLMHNLSAPTRKRLAELGTVRQRGSGRSGAGADLERGSDDGLSGELPPLRAQYGGSMTSQQQQHSPSAMDGLEQHNSGGSQLGELEMSGGSFGRQQRGAEQATPAGSMREWDTLGGRSSSVRFASHARSASGTTYPLQPPAPVQR